MDDLAAKIIKRADALRTQRQRHDEVWKDCFDHTYPIRGEGFYDGSYGGADTAKDRVSKLLTSVATDSSRMLASALMSGMTPAQAQWFDLGEVGDIDDEREWFSTSAKIIWENIHAANFDSEGYEANLDVVCAGWFALYVEEGADSMFSFQQWPIAQVCVATTRKDGIVDTIFRRYQLSAEQAAEEFGQDNVSTKIRNALASKPDQKFDFIHAIYPRKTAGGKLLAKNMPFASVHVEVADKRVVRESGYHECPVCCPRWMKIPNSVYGIGPVYDALPSIKELNEWLRMEKAAGDLAVSGMWIAEDDGVLNPRTVKVGPRKIIAASSTEAMKPLLTGSDFNVAFSSEERLEAQIRKILMADQLQPQDGPAMTATEVHVRVALIRQLLGPVYGRFQAEYLQTLVNRCFGIAFRARALPEVPQSLAGKTFTVRYISPLAQAQKLDEVTSIERLSQNVAYLAQMSPDVTDLIDADQATRTIADALGVPAKILRSDDDVEQMREQREQQQQEQQQQEMAQQLGAQAASQVVENTVGKGDDS
ncbi:phage tail protein [Salmonella enterica subsp. enterica]|nr:phage tail protein [Salmonella enterica subsp. enterica]EHC6700422.1 phage tail protein [Salmonella enterica subsp. enterica]